MDEAELEAAGLDPNAFNDPKTGFKAALFQNEQTGEFVLAFAGTEDSKDWAANVNQGPGNPESHPVLAGVSSALNGALAMLALPEVFALITWGKDIAVLDALAPGVFILPWVNLLASLLALVAYRRPKLLVATLYAAAAGTLYAAALGLIIALG